MPGATGFVSFDGIPARVPDGLIPVLRQRVDAVNASGGELFHDLKPGDPVRVVVGAFAGYDAIFDARLPGSERVRVLLKLLQQRRQLPVELAAGQIQRKPNR
jgi:transcriptional antiterminator RfaH